MREIHDSSMIMSAFVPLSGKLMMSSHYNVMTALFKKTILNPTQFILSIHSLLIHIRHQNMQYLHKKVVQVGLILLLI